MRLIVFGRQIILSMIAIIAGSAFAETNDYSYPAYPFTNDYSKGMCSIKAGLDGGNPKASVRSVDDELGFIKELDALTREIPKLVVLVGFQEGGHDHQYPMWGPANPRLKRPQDATATDSLRYLMETAASQYHTRCTVHVNMVDAYEETAGGKDYFDHGLICKNQDGTMIKGWTDTVNKRQGYIVNMKKAWDSGRTKQLIDGLVKMLPGLKQSGVIYTDANCRFTPSPFDGTTEDDQVHAYKAAIQYMKAAYHIDCIGEFGPDSVPALYGMVPLGCSLKGSSPMSLAPYIACGGDQNLGASQELEIFGHSVQLEGGENYQDTMNAFAGFARHTLPYVFLNSKLRISYDAANRSAVFSDGVKSFIASADSKGGYPPGASVITQNGKCLKVSDDLFIPEVWRTNREIMAYSGSGYEARTWDLPDNWSDVQSVDLYNVTKTGPQMIEKAIDVRDHRLRLTMKANQGQIIVPAGTDVNVNPAPEPAGTATFTGIDAGTHGNWKGKYGAGGYDIIGYGSALPSYAAVTYTGGTDAIWDAGTTNERALENPGAGAGRIAAGKEATLHEIIDVTIKNWPKRIQSISLYLLDWDNADGGRQTLVEALDAGTGRLLDSRIVNSYQKGKYLTYNASGHVRFRLTRFFKENMGKVGSPAVSGEFIN